LDSVPIMFGQIGIGTDTSLSNIVAIAAAEHYSLALNEKGTVFFSGAADNIMNSFVPKEIENIPSIMEVHASNYWCALVTEDRKLIFLGTAPRADKIPPSWDCVEEVTSFFNNIVVHCHDGTIWIWGSNLGGQLGNDNIGYNDVADGPPVRLSEYHEFLFTHKKILAKSARK